MIYVDYKVFISVTWPISMDLKRHLQFEAYLWWGIFRLFSSSLFLHCNAHMEKICKLECDVIDLPLFEQPIGTLLIEE